MTTVEEVFNQAAEDLKKIKANPSQEELLQLYGLCKQATEGDNTTPKPGFFNLQKKSKWLAWDQVKGMSQEDAREVYIKLVNELKAKYGY
ncbi:hypothetical protein PENARI_c025G11719 [Penicillium arizonense]|uniref:ACB domain-containing protein n=1 Tax=Penicillium arizonense TaxID=1835702 RepID=A0A1F5L788_PENAI|nr:hypothetical protein PENARI_c025G11719 [Penicillium arizonense]OGE48916.1 hypothetical protein PENARI_c025G11719 [Penicillium arizonense]